MTPKRVSAEALRINKKQLVRAIFQALNAEGFDETKGTTSWRRTHRKVDVFKVEFFSPAVCRKWRVPPGSFSLRPSCFFPFIPSINAEPIVCGGQPQIAQPEEGLCQLRLTIHKSISQRECSPPNIWCVDASQPDLLIADVLSHLTRDALPFYARFEDTDELLRTLIEEEWDFGRAGIWDFGKKDSPIRLLYIGFCALENQQWEVAANALLRCREKAGNIFWKERPDILSCIEDGLKRSEQATS
jgi:hypothetical protein